MTQDEAGKDPAKMTQNLYFLDYDPYGFGVNNPLAFDFSDAGAAVMDDMMRGVDGLYTIDDAAERLMEEIDYWRTRLAEIENGFTKVMEGKMEYPLEEHWDADIQQLQRSLVSKRETLDMLEGDLSMLLGRTYGDGD